MTEIAVVSQPENVANPEAKRKSLRLQRGQGMTEYIVIVALIAVAAIGVYQLFGQAVRSQTAAIVNEVGGVDGKASVAEAKAVGTAANAQRGKKGLADYAGAAAEPAVAGAK